MEVHFTPEQEAQLTQITAKEGTDAEPLVKDAALRLLEDARFRAAVREGRGHQPHVAEKVEFVHTRQTRATSLYRTSAAYCGVFFPTAGGKTFQNSASAAIHSLAAMLQYGRTAKMLVSGPAAAAFRAASGWVLAAVMM